MRENVCLLGGNTCKRKPKGQSRLDNPENLAKLGTQDGDKQNHNKNHNTICVRHHPMRKQAETCIDKTNKACMTT